MEKIGEFHFDVIYVLGAENILSDALSCIYSNDAKGTVRSPTEYTAHDNVEWHLSTHLSNPMLVGPEAVAVTLSMAHIRSDTRPAVRPVARATQEHGPQAQWKLWVVAHDSERTVIQQAHSPPLTLRSPREQLERGDPMVDELANQLQR